MKKFVILLVALSLLPAGGCVAITEGLIRSVLGIEEDDEDDFASWREEELKLETERKWIQHWRDHPDDIPAMTEAFKDDYR